MPLGLNKEDLIDVTADEDGMSFGASIHLDDDMIEKLGLDNLAVGDIVSVVAIAKISSTSEHADEEDSHKHMTIQLTKMNVKREDPDRAEQLYGKS
jgi:hypothetical protein